MDIYTRLRTRSVLHRAWFQVRKSGLRSESDDTKNKIRAFDENWLNNLAKIRTLLKNETFVFSGEIGIAPQKGKGKMGRRPLVVAPIANRIVRRALLEVLQGYGEKNSNRRERWSGVPKIREIMETPTSVGGISERGVPEGLALVENAIKNGAHWFIRSDIESFFTRIPKEKIRKYVREAVKDSRFSRIFEQALETNLLNEEELEERNLFKLFPDPEIGVAQGSALSALAGNIALKNFDAQFNCRGIVCVRYIDDFILLGTSERSVEKAYAAACSSLSAMGMNAYSPKNSVAVTSGKVDSGNVFSGTDFLGYRISGFSRQPCNAAIKKFKDKIDKIIRRSATEINAAAVGESMSPQWRYYQTMTLLHKTIWGWSQSFRHTTNLEVFDQLDKYIDKKIESLQATASKAIPRGDHKIRRRVTGVHLLVDTSPLPLPNKIDP